MNSMMRITLRVVAQNTKALADVQKQLDSINKTGSGGASSGLEARINQMEKFGKQLQWAGKQLEDRFTRPLLAGGKAVMGWALDNERAITQIRKVYGDLSMSQQQVDSDVTKLGKAFRILSDLMGINQNEVIEMGAIWAQAGASGAKLAEAVRLSAEASVLGEISSADAARDLIAIQAQWGLSTDQLRTAMAQLNVIENETSVGFGDLIDALVRGGATARTAGVDIQHYGALVAALVPAAGSAAQAGNALKTILTRVVAPTKQAAEVIQGLGININSSNWQSKTAVQRLQELANGYQKLTGPQQVFASKQLAGLYQISKFSELMRALTNNQSQYSRALDASNDAQRNAAVYQKELGIFLSSNPQALKIVTTQIKNMAVEAIGPLIPLVINLLKGFASLVRTFVGLDPRIQKVVGVLVLLLAAIGPVIAYVGSFILLGSELLRTWKAVGDILSKVGVKWSNLKAVLKAFGGAFGELGKGLKFFGDRAVDVAVGSYRSIVAAASRFWIWITNLEVVGWLKKTAITTAGWIKERAIWLAGWIADAAGEAAMWAKTLLLGEAGWLARIAQTVAGWASTFAATEVGSALVAAASVAWIPLVIAAVVAFVIIFRKQIWSGLQYVAAAFGKLPGVIVNVMRAVVRVIKEAALAFYHWLSYFNPFARHSPSLVEQVQRGVDVISAKYATLRNASSVFRQAAADYRTFLAATSGARASMDDKQFADQRADIVAVAPGAGPAADALYASLKRLRVTLDEVGQEYAEQEQVVAGWKAQLDRANEELERQNDLLDQLKKRADAAKDALDAAQDTLDTLEHTPIAGMKAMKDAIFENEMAQKRLRLEMLRMADAGKSVDDLSKKLSGLEGDIEMLRGQAEDLRLAGAGSDVLGPINDQIAALRASKNGIQGQIDGLANMQDQLDALQRQGDILDLENSLQFDPLQKQIDEVSNSMEEMPFDELLAKITAQKQVVADLTASWQQAQDAVTRQQAVVDQATAARDALQKTYDAENDKLTELGQTYDDIEQQISQMEQSLSDLASAAKSASDELGGLDVAGLGDFEMPGGLEGLAQGGDLDALIKQWQDELNGAFDDIDLGAAFKSMFDRAKTTALNWIKTNARNIGLALVGGILAVIFAPEAIAGAVAFALGAAAGWLLSKMAGPIYDAARAAVGAVMNAIGDVINAVWEAVLEPIFSAIAGFITDVLGPPFMWFWHEVIEPVWGGVTDAIQAAWKVIEPIVNFFAQVVYAAFAIIVDLIYLKMLIAWAALRTGIEVAWAGIKIVLDFFGSVFKALWDNILQPVFSALVGFIETKVVPTFQFLWQEVISPIAERIGGAISTMWGVVQPVFSALWGFINDKIVPIWEVLRTAAVSALEKLANFVGGVFDKIWGFIRRGLQLGIDAINILISGVNKLSDILPGIDFHINKIPDLPSGHATDVAFQDNRHANGYQGGGMNVGGLVPGGGPDRDSVLSYLTPGEFVLRRSAVESLGLPLVAALNSGMIPRFGFGGLIPNPWNFVKDKAGDVVDVARKGAVMAVMGPVHAAVNALAGQIPWAIPEGIVKMINNKVYDWAKGAKNGAFVRGTHGGSLLNVGEGGPGHDEAVIPLDRGLEFGHKEFHFHGDLVFPNITDESTVEDLIRDLESLAA